MAKGVRIPMYPAAESPLEAERRDQKARRAKWFDRHREIETWMTRTRGARLTLETLAPGKAFIWTAMGLATVGLGCALWWPGTIGNTLRTGLTSTKTGDLLIPPVNKVGLGLLSMQGGFFLAGFLFQTHKQKKRRALFNVDRYEEWIHRPKVTQEDLQEVLLPSYKHPNPYDPSNPHLSIVLGEFYDNMESHKYGTDALWYTLRLRGMQSGGSVIFGVTGAGKTSAALRPLMRQCFSWQADVAYDPTHQGIEKMAGFVLDPKGSLAPEVFAVLKTSGMDPVLDPRRKANCKAAPEGIVQLTPLVFRACWTASQNRVEAGAPGGSKLSQVPSEIDISDPNDLDTLRTRSDDYLELGYDEARTERVWEAFNALKESVRSMNNALGADSEYTSLQSQEKATKILLQDPTPRLDLPYTREPEPGAVHEAGHEAEVARAGWHAVSSVQRMVFWSFLAAKRPNEAAASDIREPDFLDLVGEDRPKWELEPGVPGTPAGDQNQIGGFATIRQVVRRLAPAKERPGEAVDAYRFRWLMREANLWAATRAGFDLKDRLERSQHYLEVVREIRHAHRDEQHRATWDGISRLVSVFHAPLERLLGEEAVGPEKPTRKLLPSRELKDLLQGMRAQLDPDFITRIDQGRLEDLSVPVSDRPRPHPKGQEEIRLLGTRYAEDDPMIALLHQAALMRQREHDLEARLQAWGHGPGRAGFVALDQRLEMILQARAQSLAAEVQAAIQLPVDSRQVEAYLRGVLEACRRVQGESPQVLARLIASEPAQRYKKGQAALGELFGSRLEERELAPLAVAGTKALGYLACNDLESEPGRQEFVLRVTERYATWLADARRNPGLRTDEMQRLLSPQMMLHLLDAGDQAAHTETIRPLVTKAVEVLRLELAIGTADAWEPGVAELAGGDLEGFVAAGQKVMAEVLRLLDLEDYKVSGKIPGQSARNPDGSVNSGAIAWVPLVFNEDDNPTPDFRQGPFWRGPVGGLDLTPYVTVQWNPYWSRVWWRGMSYALGSLGQGSSKDKGPAKQLRTVVSCLGNYHQAGLESYVRYVAPNVGWRTDGPYVYNPLYSPDIDLTNLAQLFNTTAFEAQSNGNDKSDPFWQNASLGVVKMLMLLLHLTDGYVTFPKIDELVTKPEALEEYIRLIEGWFNNRLGNPEDLENMSAIIKWYKGEWNTAASRKSETKDNIIKSLSVVTGVFKDPKYQVIFAPPEADQSFPSWTWCFKHGKVVVANLPTEKYEGIAKAVLPLMNRTFQKSIMLRDGQRKDLEVLLTTAPPSIESTRSQIEELRKLKVANAKATVLLNEFFNVNAKGRNSLIRNTSLNAHSAGTLGERIEAELLRKANPEWLLAFAMGVSGEGDIFSDAWARVSSGAQTAMNLGVWLRYLGERTKLVNLPPWCSAPLDQPSLDLPEQTEAGAANWRSAIEAALLAPPRPGSNGDDLAVMSRCIPGDPNAFTRKVLNSVPSLVLLPSGAFETEGFRSALRREFDRLRSELGTVGQESAKAGVSSLHLAPRIRVLYASILRNQWAIEELPNTERPACYFVDECHFYCTSEDAKFTSVARSAKAVNFYSTQSPNALFARMDQESAKQFMDNLVNRIILRVADADSAETCAKFLGGKRRVKVVEKNISQNYEDLRSEGGGRGKAMGGSVSVNVKHEERWVVELNELTSLPAMQCFCSTWDGFKASPPRRVYMKPDYLFASTEVRDYQRETAKKLPKLPAAYADHTDLYALTVPRLIQLGVIDPSR